jgi:N-acetylmuramoyl-L-alanine amidase
MEKNLVLGFGLALRDRVEKTGKYRVVMTRTDDTFVPLADRVKVARNEAAALFVSIHADALPRGEGDAQGATIYTLSDKASDSQGNFGLANLLGGRQLHLPIGGVWIDEALPLRAKRLARLGQRRQPGFLQKGWARL